MSHFTVCVVTTLKPTPEIIAMTMARYKETGHGNDGYGCFEKEVNYLPELMENLKRHPELDAPEKVAEYFGMALVSDPKDYTGNHGSCIVCKRGEIIAAYRYTNPNGFWDYYGFTPRLTLKSRKNSDCAQLRDIDQLGTWGEGVCFAIIIDGVWHSRGKMGWFAVVHDEKTSWQSEFAKLIGSLPDSAWISTLDAHV